MTRQPFQSEIMTFSVADGVAHCVLTRPELMNRVDEEMHGELRRVLQLVEEDEQALVFVLSSTGRAFSAGGDAAWLQQVHANPALARTLINEGRHLMTQLLSLRVPVICAVQGAAMGLGANIAFASDAVVAVAAAPFADPHVRMGLVAGDGGVVVWPQSAGMLRARRYLLTGDSISGAEAFAAGLVTDLVETEAELLPAALELATRIAALPPLAVQGTKRALNQATLQGAGRVFDLSLALELDTTRSDDLLEATAAFLERRPGDFKGR